MIKTFPFIVALLLTTYTSKVYASDEAETSFEDRQAQIQQALNHFKPEIELENSDRISGPFMLRWRARTHVPSILRQKTLSPADIRAGRGQRSFLLKNLLVLTGDRTFITLDRNVPKVIITENKQIGRDANTNGDSLLYMDSRRKPVYQDIKVFPFTDYLSPAQDTPTDLQTPAKPYFQVQGNLLLSQNHFNANKVRVTAFDVSTSKVVWKKEFENNYSHGFEDRPEDGFEHEYLNRLGNATDAIIGDRYIFSTLDTAERQHHVRALTLTTGEILWEKTFKRENELCALEIISVGDYLLLSGIVRVASEKQPRLHRVAIALDSRNGKEVGRLEHVWDYKWNVQLAFADENNLYYFADSYQQQEKELTAINWRSGEIIWKTSFSNSNYLKELLTKNGSMQHSFKTFTDYIPIQLEDPDGVTYKSHLLLINRNSGIPHFIFTLGRKLKGSDIGISPVITSKYLYAASGGVLYAIESTGQDQSPLYDFWIDFSEDMTQEEKSTQAMKNEELISAYYGTEDVDIHRVLKKEILARSSKTIDLLIPHLYSDSKLSLTGAPNTERYLTLRLLANMNDPRLADIWRKEATVITHAGSQSGFEFDGKYYLLFAYHERLLAQHILKKKYGIDIHAPILELIAFKDPSSSERFFTKWSEADKNTDFLEAYKTLDTIAIQPHPIEYIIGQLERDDCSGKELWKWENKLRLFLDTWEYMEGSLPDIGFEERAIKRPVDRMQPISKMTKDERRDAVQRIKKWWTSIQDSTVIKAPKP